MKEKTYNIMVLAVIVLGMVLVVQMLTRCDNKQHDKIITDTIIVHDSIPYPVLDSIEIVKYKPYEVIVKDTITRDSIHRDTIEIEVPISKYKLDTTLPNQANLKAEIEGFAVEMNYLAITYPTATTTTIKKPRKKRWGIGVQAGYGLSTNGNQIYGSPYIGIGISYSILQF